MADPVATSHHAIAPSPGDPVTFTLDGRDVEARPGEFLIAAAERAGTYIPRFCYHPRMKPVGMCRMCLVEVSGPRGATLQPACYIPVAQGMEVVTTSDKVKKAQDGVLEFLLVNHPLDCPVCDKGGECPLQDQTLAYGPGESRFVEEKRHWAKPVPISELVLLDRERCIQCGRCVRFASELAGEAEIDLIGRGDGTEINIAEGHPFDSYFSGNTVQICPVGALTASPYRFTARPWDLDQVESTCTTCAVGCRVAVQSSANRVTRLLGMDADPVNQSWLCDKGRFASDAVAAEGRLTEPQVRGEDGVLHGATWAEALGAAADRISAVVARAGAEAVGVIGGARGSNEDAYAWARLAKAVLGTDSVDAQLGDGLPAELVLGLPRATIDDACRASCVIVLSGDLREELPVLHLRLRQAAVDGGTTVVELSTRPSRLADVGVHLRTLPGQAAELLAALVATSRQGQGAGAPTGVDPAAWAAAVAALAAAPEGDGVVVVLGRPQLAEDAGVVAAAAATLAEELPGARFLPALRRGNVLGGLDMGLAPGVLPGRVGLDDGRAWFEAAWGSVPGSRGRDSSGILAALADGEMEALVLVGADPLGDFPDRALARRALERASVVVAVDTFLSASCSLASVVLPTVMQHERSGTTTNIEGRVTRLGQKVVPPGQCWPDWMIAVELADRLGGDLGFGNLTELWDQIEQYAPSHAGLTRSVLESSVARDGIVVPLPATAVPLPTRRDHPRPFDPMATPGIESVERQGAPPRAGFSEPLGGEDLDDAGTFGQPDGDGRSELPSRPPLLGVPSVDAPRVSPCDQYSLRLVATRQLYDEGVQTSMSEALAALAPPLTVRVHPTELQRLGVAPGDSVRLRSARGGVTMPAEPDPELPAGVAWVGFNLSAGDGAGAGDLITTDQPVVDIRLESLA